MLNNYSNEVVEKVSDSFYINTIRQCQTEIYKLREKLNPIILNHIKPENSSIQEPRTEIDRELCNLLDIIKDLNSDIRI